MSRTKSKNKEAKSKGVHKRSLWKQEARKYKKEAQSLREKYNKLFVDYKELRFLVAVCESPRRRCDILEKRMEELSEKACQHIGSQAALLDELVLTIPEQLDIIKNAGIEAVDTLKRSVALIEKGDHQPLPEEEEPINESEADEDKEDKEDS